MNAKSDDFDEPTLVLGKGPRAPKRFESRHSWYERDGRAGSRGDGARNSTTLEEQRAWPAEEHERTTARAFAIPDYEPDDEDRNDDEEGLRRTPRSSSPELLTPKLMARLGDRLAEHSYDELEIEVTSGAERSRFPTDEMDERAMHAMFAAGSDAFGEAIEAADSPALPDTGDSIDIEIFRGEADDSLHDTMSSAMPDTMSAAAPIGALGSAVAGAIGSVATIDALSDDQDEADYASFEQGMNEEMERAETNELGEETDEDAGWWMRLDATVLGEPPIPIDDVDLPTPPGVISGVAGGRGLLDRRLIDALESPTEVQCSCGHDCDQREHSLAALIRGLSANESRRLHLRLTMAQYDDTAARAFKALPAEHRSRVLDLLDRHARRQAAVGPNWRVVRKP